MDKFKRHAKSHSGPEIKVPSPDPTAAAQSPRSPRSPRKKFSPMNLIPRNLRSKFREEPVEFESTWTQFGGALNGLAEPFHGPVVPERGSSLQALDKITVTVPLEQDTDLATERSSEQTTEYITSDVVSDQTDKDLSDSEPSDTRSMFSFEGPHRRSSSRYYKRDNGYHPGVAAAQRAAAAAELEYGAELSDFDDDLNVWDDEEDLSHLEPSGFDWGLHARNEPLDPTADADPALTELDPAQDELLPDQYPEQYRGYDDEQDVYDSLIDEVNLVSDDAADELFEARPLSRSQSAILFSDSPRPPLPRQLSMVVRRTNSVVTLFSAAPSSGGPTRSQSVRSNRTILTCIEERN